MKHNFMRIHSRTMCTSTHLSKDDAYSSSSGGRVKCTAKRGPDAECPSVYHSLEADMSC